MRLGLRFGFYTGVEHNFFGVVPLVGGAGGGPFYGDTIPGGMPEATTLASIGLLLTEYLELHREESLMYSGGRPLLKEGGGNRVYSLVIPPVRKDDGVSIAAPPRAGVERQLELHLCHIVL
ncbi:hypothetical protein [Pyrobaculum sp.]|uniref:hypothetical protein n=1 Tax=Pyrobaculum sp. TaxID=2004705 RepID=UPI003D14F80A